LFVVVNISEEIVYEEKCEALQLKEPDLFTALAVLI
jgi:hypothetical protein